MVQASKKNMQIMIIDSDKLVRESLRVFLDDEPFRYLIFKSGRDGLNALKYQEIDVVIADYFLPDMDGLVLLQQVAQKNPNASRILMATIASEDLKEEIFKHQIDALIEKPLSIASIDQILNDIAREKSIRENTIGDAE